MLRNLYIVFLLTVMAALSACESNEPRPQQPRSRRVVLVYMEARNNLSDFAYDDIKEMKRAAIPDDCRLLIYKSIRYHDHPTLVEIKNGEEIVIEDYPAEASAVDPDHMVQVIEDASRHAPGPMGIILWSHSTGWMQKSARYSRGYGLENGVQMSVSNLAQALQGHDLEFIFFDTCYMGSVEVAYELRRCAPRMVASVCEVPARGMPYDKTLPHIFSDPLDQGLQKAVDANVDFYLADPNEKCPSTMSLIDLTALDDLAASVKPAYNPEAVNAAELQRFSISTPYKYLMFDFGQYAEQMGVDPAALNRAVIHERHTPSIWGVVDLAHCSGLSVFVPNSTYDFTSYDYNTLAWYKYLNN